MKKLTISIVALCLGLSSLLLKAEDAELRDNHPASYTVVKGDTLWDISGTFLKNPWMWPEIWYVNPQIENPHLIYPGDVIKLVYLDGVPRLTLERGKRNYKLSPQVRITPIDTAIPAIPLDEIDKFLSRSRVLSEAEIEAAPYVLSGVEKHLVVGAGSRLYARGAFDDEVSIYGVYRPQKKYFDPQTGEMLGIMAQDIGSVDMTALDEDVGTFDVTRTTEEIRIADRLLPNEKLAVETTFYPSVPKDDIKGSIIAVEGGLTQVGTMDVVIINRGEREGLEVGNVLAIFKNSGQIRDRVTGDLVQLPDERAGVMMVFRTFEKMSFGLVLESSRPLAVDDKVARP